MCLVAIFLFKTEKLFAHDIRWADGDQISGFSFDFLSEQSAIDFLSAQNSLNHTAHHMNKTESELISLFRHESRFTVHKNKHPSSFAYRVFYFDPDPQSQNSSHSHGNHQQQDDLRSLESGHAEHGDIDLASRTISPADAFTLHSRPGSSKTIYIDFLGRHISNSAWNKAGATIIAPPFDCDGDPSSFSANERNVIIQATPCPTLCPCSPIRIINPSRKSESQIRIGVSCCMFEWHLSVFASHTSTVCGAVSGGESGRAGGEWRQVWLREREREIER